MLTLIDNEKFPDFIIYLGTRDSCEVQCFQGFPYTYH
jgi:hypothetical protein